MTATIKVIEKEMWSHWNHLFSISEITKMQLMDAVEENTNMSETYSVDNVYHYSIL